MSKRRIESPETGGTEASPSKRPAGPQFVKNPKLPPAPHKATVKELAMRVVSSTADIDNETLQRIKKCLDRGNHPGTPEAEAKAAFFLASRLMKQFNVTQAEVLAHEPPSAQRQYADHSIVSISAATDEGLGKPVRFQKFYSTLAIAMTVFFDCKSYTNSSDTSINVIFYGIAENTVAATMAYEMAFNLIMEWRRPYKGVGSKNSYVLGVSNELLHSAWKEKEEEERNAKKSEADALAKREEEEAAARQAEIDRLGPHLAPYNPLNSEYDQEDGPKFKSEPSDDDESDSAEARFSCEDEDDIQPDFDIADEDQSLSVEDLDEEIRKLAASQPLSSGRAFEGYTHPAPVSTYGFAGRRSSICVVKQEPEESKVKLDASLPFQKPNVNQNMDEEHHHMWASHKQLIIFRDTAKEIADNYLKEKGVTLSKGRKLSNKIRDPDAYAQGKKDSKKIDVHRKQIKE